MLAKENQILELAPMLKKIWPEHSIEELNEIIKEYMNSENSAVFTSVKNNECVAAALCCLRFDYVEGCESSPVGYLEGIYVKEKWRNLGIAKSLCEECEQWAKEKGCSEFASDCELTNTVSYNFHLKIGFLEENRIIHFKKKIN